MPSNAPENELNQSCVFGNTSNAPRLLSVEPLGEDFWVLPDQQLTFHWFGEPESLQIVEGRDMFGVEQGDHITSLYPPECYDWAVFEGEIAVECGHNRPNSWAEELQAKYDAITERVRLSNSDGKS